jgi:hypothetical protein
MKSLTIKSAEQGISLFNTNHGEFINSVEDFSPSAKLARAIILTISHPGEVSFDGSKGDCELF